MAFSRVEKGPWALDRNDQKTAPRTDGRGANEALIVRHFKTVFSFYCQTPFLPCHKQTPLLIVPYFFVTM